MRRLLLLLVLTIVPSLAAAADQGFPIPKVFKTAAGSQNLLDDVALNAADATTRTITLTLNKQYSKALVKVFFTWGAASTVTATPTLSQDGTNYASKTTKACVSGACTVSKRVDTYTTGGVSANIELEFDVAGQESLKVLLGGASAGGSDLVDVQATAIVGI